MAHLYSASIYKIDEKLNVLGANPFMVLSRCTKKEGLVFLLNPDNHPAIECAGFCLELQDADCRVIDNADYIYGTGWLSELKPL